jgi:NNP family nitrate/nitrite transporter-like MFS transporter
MTGFPQSTFFVIFVVSLIATAWMHFTVVKMLHHASPTLANKFEHEVQSLDEHETMLEESGVNR